MTEGTLSPQAICDVGHSSPAIEAAAVVDQALPHITVFEARLVELDGATISLQKSSTPCRFRLLDCAAFLDAGCLRIVEYFSFTPKELRYAAVSYPWRDLQLPNGMQPPEGSFRVHGAEAADPITIAVLRTACMSARYFGASLLWLDRLCIMQTAKNDKNWQIERMYPIYVYADPCLVLPGGLVRLARLDETTTWIDRAWTLQEAAANLTRDVVKCIYSFSHATFADYVKELPDNGWSSNFKNDSLSNKKHEQITRHIVEPGISAACEIMELFSWIELGFMWFSTWDPELSADYKNFPFRIVFPPAAKLLSHSLVYNRRINYQFFWMSAFTRSSSRPVDMVFSIMGPMGVQLRVADFEAHERTKATIKLIQALLARGDPANWLFIAPELPPSPELSILPAFPETSVSGQATIRTPHGPVSAFEAVGLTEPWKTDGAPKGVLSDDGYFSFHSRGVLVCNQPQTSQDNTDGVGVGMSIRSETWAVVVGRRREFNRDPETGLITAFDPEKPFPVIVELTLMFIEKHGNDNSGKELFHRIGMEHEVDESKTSGWTWFERDFIVGGQGKGDRVRFTFSSTSPVFISP